MTLDERLKEIDLQCGKRLYSIRQRCENPKSTGYKYYGAKGVKCLISKEELRKLWIRDDADSLIKPSINRRNPDGNYEFSNCDFIELGMNSKIAHIRGRFCVKGHEYTDRNTITNSNGHARCRLCTNQQGYKYKKSHKSMVKKHRHNNYVKHKQKYLTNWKEWYHQKKADEPKIESKYVGIYYNRTLPYQAKWTYTRYADGREYKSNRFLTEIEAINAYKNRFGCMPIVRGGVGSKKEHTKHCVIDKCHWTGKPCKSLPQAQKRKINSCREEVLRRING